MAWRKQAAIPGQGGCDGLKYKYGVITMIMRFAMIFRFFLNSSLKSLLSIAALMYINFISAQEIKVGVSLPAWQNGYLDLHHINTGRGNSAFFIFPDGTTMLLDAGEMSPLEGRIFTARNSVIRPDSSKKPYEWIVNYIHQVAPLNNRRSIDYGLITHFHDDHFGGWYPDAPRSASGHFQLTGITGVGELMPVKILFDRGYPGYDYPYDMKKLAEKNQQGETRYAKSLQNYFSFIDEKKKQGMQMASFKAGSNRQIVLLKNPSAFPSFSVQNIKANQKIWTGKDTNTYNHFPAIDTAKPASLPDENSLSLAIAINYGDFKYYTGGDNPGNIFTGDNPLRDVETPIAKVVGAVDIATMDHHGNRDAVNEFMVKTLQPKVWIGQTWSADHPGHEVLLRIVNQHIYPGQRDLFATNMLEANWLVIGPLIDRVYKSQQGHIVVRVMPGGNAYYIVILDDTRSDIPVKAVFGPYQSVAGTKNRHPVLNSKP
jgi:beta-lactamase superfamily II metal-dependent hydrolase